MDELEGRIRRAVSEFVPEQWWCPWCLEQPPGAPHGTADAAGCECRLLTR